MTLQTALAVKLAGVGPATPIEELFKLAQLASDMAIVSPQLTNEIAARVAALVPTDPLYQLFALHKMQKAPTGGTDVGQLAEYPLGGPEKIRIGGRVYLEMGAIETDPTEFDQSYWAQWRGLLGMSLPFDADMSGVTIVGAAQNGGRVCAIGYAGSSYYAFLSDNYGQSFERVALPMTTTPQALYCLAGRFYAVSGTGQVLTSATGAAGTWVSVLTGGTNQSINSIAANGNTVVAVGQKGLNTPVIYRATDAVTFAEVSAPTFAGQYRGVSFDATLNRWYCASSANGDLYTSDNNAMAWTMTQALGANATSLAGVVRLDGGLYAVATSNHVWRWTGSTFEAMGAVAAGLHPTYRHFVLDGALYGRSDTVATLVRKTADFATFETVFNSPVNISNLVSVNGSVLALPPTPTDAIPVYQHWLDVVAGSTYRSSVMDRKIYVRIK